MADKDRNHLRMASMNLVAHSEGAFEVFGETYRPEWDRPPIGEDGYTDRNVVIQMVNVGIDKLTECSWMDYRVPERVRVVRYPNGEISASPRWITSMVEIMFE